MSISPDTHAASLIQNKEHQDFIDKLVLSFQDIREEKAEAKIRKRELSDAGQAIAGDRFS